METKVITDKSTARNVTSPRAAGHSEPISATRRPIHALGQLIRRLAQDQRGGLSVLLGLATPVLVGGAAVAVDTAAWYGAKNQVQQVADAAAMGGARAIALGLNATVAQANATRDAARNGYVDGGGATLTFASPPSSGPNAGNAAAVEIIVTRPLPSFFSSFLLGSGARTVRARSVALNKEVLDSNPNRAVCMLALATTGEKAIFMNGSGSVVANGCSMGAWSTNSRALYLNGSGSIGGHTAFLRGDDYRNGSGSFVFTEAVQSGYLGALDDPYASLANPVVPGACLRTNFATSGSGTVTLSPGRYCGGINNGGSGTINLLPGTYYIDGGNVENGSGNILCPTCGSGAGVTLVFTSSTDPAANTGALVTGGSGNVILPAPGPSSGEPYVGMVIYMDRRATVATRELGIDNSGSGLFQLSGAVYVPGRKIKLNGSGTVNQAGMGCATIIGQTITLIGSGTIQTGDCATMGTVLPRPRKKEIVLAE